MAEQNGMSIELRMKEEAVGYLRKAEGLKVVDQESSSAAQRIVADLKGWIKNWKAYWKEPKEKAKAAHTILCEREGAPFKLIDPVIVKLSDQIAAWTMAEREKARIAQEARDKAEWEAKQAEEKKDVNLATAVDFEDVKLPAKVEIPPAVVKPKTDDVQLRDHWVWEVEDFESIPRRYLAPDKEMIDQKIADTPNKNDETVKGLIPGIRVFNKPIVAAQFKRRS